MKKNSPPQRLTIVLGHPSAIMVRSRRNRIPRQQLVELRAQLTAAQDGLCAYCNRNPGYELHAEHMIPVSRGGDHGPENLIGACAECNSSKGEMTPLEYMLERLKPYRLRRRLIDPDNALRRQIRSLERRIARLAHKRDGLLGLLARRLAKEVA